MLIKPWTDLPAPRHALNEEDNEQNPILPEISISIEDAYLNPEYYLVSPHNIEILLDSIPFTSSQIGEIRIIYKDADATSQLEDDYDEDEQLYAAIDKKKEYETITIPILAFTDKSNHISVYTIIPYFKNIIVYNYLSRKILSTLSPTQIISISPCPLNNNESLNKLVSVDFKQSHLMSQIPLLRPPHFITGICASIASVSTVKKTQYVSLILDAEGQLGYEKLSNDSILDACIVLSDLYKLNEQEKSIYLKSVSTSIRKFNAYSNSGMYI